MGVEESIPLSTIKGLIGYKVKKFQILSAAPGSAIVEFIAQIYKTSETSNVNTTPDFSDSRLLGVSYYEDNVSAHEGISKTIIFDSEIFNKDIYVNITDAGGGSTRCNYYIELEQMDIALDEAAVATLKDIRNND